MKKICMLGDSITKGIIFDEKKTKYLSCENSFVNLFGAGKELFIDNLSMFGCTITKGIQILKRQYEKVSSCDIVVTEFGGNDCDFDWDAISKNPEGEFSPKTSLELFCEQYKKMLEAIIKTGKKIAVINLPPLDDEKYFNWVSRDKNKENILKWLGGSTKYIYRWHEMYNDAVCNVARSMNVVLVDIRTAFLCLRDYSMYLCQDGIHPNEMGHRLIFERINGNFDLFGKTDTAAAV